MTAADFRAGGYLAFVNRRVLHPLGMALEVVVEDDGRERFGQVWDYRDDPEGIRFVGLDEYFLREQEGLDFAWERAAAARRKMYGWVVQPPACALLPDGGLPRGEDGEPRQPAREQRIQDAAELVLSAVRDLNRAMSQLEDELEEPPAAGSEG